MSADDTLERATTLVFETMCQLAQDYDIPRETVWNDCDAMDAARETARGILALLSVTAGDGAKVGPQPIITPVEYTCTGCKHLTTKRWEEYLDDDERDSGTTACCSAAEGKCIDHYWHHRSPTPDWCPVALARLSTEEPH